MNRRTALTVAVAALALVAVALAAATLDTARTDQGGGLGLGPTEQPGVGEADGGSIGGGGDGTPPFEPGDASVCLPVLNSTPVVMGIVAAFLVLAYVLYRETGTAFVPAGVVGAFGIPVFLLHTLLTSCGPPADGGGRSLLPAVPSERNGSSILPPGAGSTGVSDAASQVTAPTFALGIVLVLALAGSVLLLFASTGDDEEPVPDEEPDPPAETDVAAVGRAAGDAADRIEGDADVDNEVYRAWREMTDHVAVDSPRSSTPGEFAAAAVAAGMAREDVTELTALFEDVRYGGETPTADYEERAVAALRRIERAYAEGDAPAGDPTDGDGTGDPTDDGAGRPGGSR